MRTRASMVREGNVEVVLEGEELDPIAFAWRPESAYIEVDPATGEVAGAAMGVMAMPPTRDLTESEVAALMAAHDVRGAAALAAREGLS